MFKIIIGSVIVISLMIICVNGITNFEVDQSANNLVFFIGWAGLGYILADWVF